MTSTAGPNSDVLRLLVWEAARCVTAARAGVVSGTVVLIVPAPETADLNRWESRRPAQRVGRVEFDHRTGATRTGDDPARPDRLDRHHGMVDSGVAVVCCVAATIGTVVGGGTVTELGSRRRWAHEIDGGGRIPAGKRSEGPEPVALDQRLHRRSSGDGVGRQRSDDDDRRADAVGDHIALHRRAGTEDADATLLEAAGTPPVDRVVRDHDRRRRSGRRQRHTQDCCGSGWSTPCRCRIRRCRRRRCWSSASPGERIWFS